MLIKYLSLALLLLTMTARGQDSAYRKERVSKTDLQVFYGFYLQNGNHSAITGGIGTEHLKVFSPMVSFSHQPDSNRTISINGGVDIITSASMDNIDFIVSSASKVSERAYVNLGYRGRLGHSHTSLGVGTGFSTESAYESIPASVSLEHTDRQGVSRWSASLQCYFDDLRWGRLENFGRPVTLIYPFELRDTTWFSIYRRFSYNLDFAYYAVINKRTQLALYPELVYQHGLLCTPYHRVYFDDSAHTERVENLPRDRWKLPLAAQLNTFVGSRTILRFYYRWYVDSWGIQAHSLQLEAPVKFGPLFSIAPLLRFHTQSAASYFRPYKEHSLAETYYTSDYDLSAFQSYKAGVTFRYAPMQGEFQAISLRYDFYKRSDGLAAHILSLLVELGHTREHH
jgi:hypothetical protein